MKNIIFKLLHEFNENNNEIKAILCGGQTYDLFIKSNNVQEYKQLFVPTSDFDLKFSYVSKEKYNDLLTHINTDEKTYLNTVKTKLTDIQKNIIIENEKILYNTMYKFLKNTEQILNTIFDKNKEYDNFPILCLNNTYIQFTKITNEQEMNIFYSAVFNDTQINLDTNALITLYKYADKCTKLTIGNVIQNMEQYKNKSQVSNILQIILFYYLTIKKSCTNIFLSYHAMCQCIIILLKSKNALAVLKKSNKKFIISCCSGSGTTEISEEIYYKLRFPSDIFNDLIGRNSLIEIKQFSSTSKEVIDDLLDCTIFTPFSFLSTRDTKKIYSFDIIKNSLYFSGKIIDYTIITSKLKSELSYDNKIYFSNEIIDTYNLYVQSKLHLLIDSYHRIIEKCPDLTEYNQKKINKYFKKFIGLLIRINNDIKNQKINEYTLDIIKNSQNQPAEQCEIFNKQYNKAASSLLIKLMNFYHKNIQHGGNYLYETLKKSYISLKNPDYITYNF